MTCSYSYIILYVACGCAQESAKQRRGRVKEILELMGLAHCEKTRASSLSGGERRRLGALSQPQPQPPPPLDATPARPFAFVCSSHTP